MYREVTNLVLPGRGSHYCMSQSTSKLAVILPTILSKYLEFCLCSQRLYHVKNFVMEKKQFKIEIAAPGEKVWNILWGDTTYPVWTSVFAEGSSVETIWEEGSKVLFLDGKGAGMVSTIAQKIPNKFMSFKHLGTVKNGVEDLDSEQTKQWSGALENYTLQTVDGKTDLVVDMDMTEEFKDYFINTWPKALDKVKELAEKN